jgi:beta-barrel assembly-enhancing protease
MKNAFTRKLITVAVASAMMIAPLAALAQTRISAPSNKYKIQDDIKLGRDTAAQVDRQFPILNDFQSSQYIEEVGRRLANSIPPEFQHPEFQYSFKIVNARDINAFALPGGPMYVNRGMIEAAQNEGEMAGVMAHELSHVALRHSTAQQTRVNNPINQILGIGAILGGAIVGGQSGAQLGQTIVAGYFLSYSREYETQADTLGAQIMARAGYDPRDLANMFKTIERESGGSNSPEWLSSHPSPANRYQNIEREATLLRVSPEPIKLTPGFQRTKRYLQSLPRARTMAEIEKGASAGAGSGSGTGSGGGADTGGMASGTYQSRVDAPSSRTRVYQGGNWIQLSVPDNWQTVSESQSEVWFAPAGAYGSQGITRGALLGVTPAGTSNLRTATDSYVDGLLTADGNNYLSRRGGYSQTTVGGKNSMTLMLSGTSPITNRAEIVTIYTTILKNNDLLHIVTVSPQGEAGNYDYAFRSMIRSVRLND